MVAKIISYKEEKMEKKHIIKHWNRYSVVYVNCTISNIRRMEI